MNSFSLFTNLKKEVPIQKVCDVTFLVGANREPITAVKSSLAKKSRVFFKMFLRRSICKFLKKFIGNQRKQVQAESGPSELPANHDHDVIVIENVEPEVFRELIAYIHNEKVNINRNTLHGLTDAADYYGLKGLRRACTSYAWNIFLEDITNTCRVSPDYHALKEITWQQIISTYNGNGESSPDDNQRDELEVRNKIQEDEHNQENGSRFCWPFVVGNPPCWEKVKHCLFRRAKQFTSKLHQKSKHEWGRMGFI